MYSTVFSWWEAQIKQQDKIADIKIMILVRRSLSLKLIIKELKGLVATDLRAIFPSCSWTKHSYTSMRKAAKFTQVF